MRIAQTLQLVSLTPRRHNPNSSDTSTIVFVDIKRIAQTLQQVVKLYADRIYNHTITVNELNFVAYASVRIVNMCSLHIIKLNMQRTYANHIGLQMAQIYIHNYQPNIGLPTKLTIIRER